MLPAVLALTSSLAWGCSDFLGGLASRRLPLLTVMLLSGLAGSLGVAGVVLARGVPVPGGEFALYAALAGISGVIGIAAFYRGLAIGVMSVVAPVSAAGAVIPVAVGLASGERPAAWQIAGALLAITGVVLVSRQGASEDEDAESRERSAATARGVPLALLAGAGFGGFFVLMDHASEGDVWWAILTARSTSTASVVVAVLALRPRLATGAADWGLLSIIGLLDVGANVLFSIASTKGLLSLVGVLSSLYPVITIFLARTVLHERIARSQQVGVVATLAGVLLISATG